MIAERTFHRIASGSVLRRTVPDDVETLAALLCEARRSRGVKERPWSALPDHRKQAYRLDAAFVLSRLTNQESPDDAHVTIDEIRSRCADVATCSSSDPRRSVA